MQVDIGFYESASQILVVLLLAESVRVAFLFKERAEATELDEKVVSMSEDISELKEVHGESPEFRNLEESFRATSAEVRKERDKMDRRTSLYMIMTSLLVLGELLALLTCLYVLADHQAGNAATSALVLLGLSFGFSGVAMPILLPLRVKAALHRQRVGNYLIYFVCVLSFLMPVGLFALLL